MHLYICAFAIVQLAIQVNEV